MEEYAIKGRINDWLNPKILLKKIPISLKIIRKSNLNSKSKVNSGPNFWIVVKSIQPYQDKEDIIIGIHWKNGKIPSFIDIPNVTK